MNERADKLVREDCRRVLDGREKQLAALKGDTLFITGGTGFMGTWLAEMLACLNDDFSFKTKVFLMARNTDKFQGVCPHLAGRKDMTLVKSDIRRLSELPKQTHWVIHAAVTPDNRFHSSRPVETMSTVSEGIAAVIRAADPCSDFKKLLNISSGLVYGTQPWETERIPESHVGGPVMGNVASVYAEAKRYAEIYCAAARSQQKLPVVTARPFAFVGPYQSLNTPWAINNFIHDALNAKIIRVLGDGKTVRSYLYGADMSFWLLRILVDGVSGQAYNVGSPDGISLEQLAGLIAEQFDPQPEIRIQASVPAVTQRTRFVPDVTLAAEGLKLSVKTPLKAAIKQTIEWNKLSRSTAVAV
ncbi:MAG TPA: NAD-dependent epimerase/dehydratase family protein [Elusimicrobiota bacterium]|nr:NAD-dependent epimerase/dehydratase family protein [Elusimicrobiota bacterium]